MARSSRPPAPDRSPDTVYDVDVLVVGAGPAGREAARSAATRGLRVLLVHDGGPLPAEAAPLAPRRPAPWLAGHTALELLVDEHGAVRGAAGVRQPEGGLPGLGPVAHWQAQAGAVVLACGARPGGLGWLMAAEAGATLAEVDGAAPGLLCDTEGATPVPGLFAAGALAQTPGQPPDAGPGAPPAGRHAAPGLPAGTLAQALLSGQRAGDGAARRVLQARHAAARAVGGAGTPRPAGGVGLRGPGSHPISPQAARAALQAVRAQRDGHAALVRLDALWQFLRSAAPAPAAALRPTRHAAAELAWVRWHTHCTLARALARGEPGHLLCGGLDQVWARHAPLARHGDGGARHAPAVVGGRALRAFAR